MRNDDVLQHLAERHGELLTFWTTGDGQPAAAIQDHCDMVYTLRFLGMTSSISPRAIERFVEKISTIAIPGWTGGEGKPLSVHNLAYVFGALNLLPGDRPDLYSGVLKDRTRQVDQLVDPDTSLPVFPKQWAHHNWRVSHWLGGVPSVLLSMSRAGLPESKIFGDLLRDCREAVEKVIDPETGRLHAYQSDLVQQGFRRLYAIRHDPDLGELGGIAHVLWIDHATDRPYTGLDDLAATSSKELDAHRPFMESVPYCLDFDIVQIVRTAFLQLDRPLEPEVARASDMMRDIEDFFAGPVPESYTLHKVPGALATYHECALIAGVAVSDGAEPVDIIREAHWL